LDGHNVYEVIAAPTRTFIRFPPFDTCDVQFRRFYPVSEPIPNTCAVDAIADAEVKDGGGSLMDNIADDVGECRVAADGHVS
jgi:hypothetical protein